MFETVIGALEASCGVRLSQNNTKHRLTSTQWHVIQGVFRRIAKRRLPIAFPFRFYPRLPSIWPSNPLPPTTSEQARTGKAGLGAWLVDKHIHSRIAPPWLLCAISIGLLA
jgi:hypothetical protein